MPHVAALYRYPVKGFTPESPAALTVLADGRIEGDRVLTFRFASAPGGQLLEDGSTRWAKTDGLAMQDTPSIGALRLAYDRDARRVRIEHEGRLLADEALDEAGRAALCEAVTAYLLETPDAARLRSGGRLPLRLEGDGVTSQFQDRPLGYVSIHGRGSLLALGEALDQDVDERRFRSNVAIEGVLPWEELDWTGRVRVGAVMFHVERHTIRCLATHANPDTGVRDLEVLTTLTRAFGHEQPAFGTLLLPDGPGGVIHVGDEVEPLD